MAKRGQGVGTYPLKFISTSFWLFGMKSKTGLLLRVLNNVEVASNDITYLLMLLPINALQSEQKNLPLAMITVTFTSKTFISAVS